MIAASILLAAIGSVIAVLYFKPKNRIRREIKQATRYRIADLPEGVHGQIVGRAYVLIESLQGPLTGRPCVYYVARVEECIKPGRPGRWRTLITETRGVPFGIQDSTGRALIDPTMAKVSLDSDGDSVSGTYDNPTEVERAFLARYDQSGKGLIFNKDLRYREAIIGIDEMVSIVGAGVREPDPDAPPTDGYRAELPTRLRLSSTPEHRVLISDWRSDVIS